MTLWVGPSEKSQHPWKPAMDEFQNELLPKLKAAGKTIGRKADQGDQLCKKIMANYAILYKSFDPIFYIVLKASFDEYIKSIKGIEGNTCAFCGANAGPYTCEGCGGT